MIKTERIEREKLKRGGLLLFYLDDDRSTHEVTIYVDKINCVMIKLGHEYRDFMSFYLVENDGHTANDYIEMIKEQMDVSYFPSERAMDIYKELLDDKELRICLDSCIVKIPNNPAVAAFDQIAMARAKLDEITKKALDKYESEIKSIVNTQRNVESVKEFVTENNCGLVNRDYYTSCTSRK